MRVLFFRHGDKTHGNSDRIPPGALRYDPLLIPSAVGSIQQTLVRVPADSNPSLLIVSPYLRARETADILQGSLGGVIPRAYDVRVGEYLGNQRRHATPEAANRLISPSTAYLLYTRATFDGTTLTIPPTANTYESMDELKARVESFVASLRAYAREHPNAVVWVVAHGLTITTAERAIAGTSTTDGMDYAAMWETTF